MLSDVPTYLNEFYALHIYRGLQIDRREPNFLNVEFRLKPLQKRVEGRAYGTAVAGPSWGKDTRPSGGTGLFCSEKGTPACIVSWDGHFGLDRKSTRSILNRR